MTDLNEGETLQDEPEEQPQPAPTGCYCGCEVDGSHDECDETCLQP